MLFFEHSASPCLREQCMNMIHEKDLCLTAFLKYIFPGQARSILSLIFLQSYLTSDLQFCLFYSIFQSG